jgi:hypothetical protein
MVTFVFTLTATQLNLSDRILLVLDYASNLYHKPPACMVNALCVGSAYRHAIRAAKSSQAWRRSLVVSYRLTYPSPA